MHEIQQQQPKQINMNEKNNKVLLTITKKLSLAMVGKDLLSKICLYLELSINTCFVVGLITVYTILGCFVVWLIIADHL